MQAAAGDLPTFPPDRIAHVIARHTAAAVSPKPDDGIFYPEFSTSAKLVELAYRIYGSAGAPHVGASKGGGRYASSPAL